MSTVAIYIINSSLQSIFSSKAKKKGQDMNKPTRRLTLSEMAQISLYTNWLEPLPTSFRLQRGQAYQNEFGAKFWNGYNYVQ